MRLIMESNKDEALRCISIAKSAVASGDKQRALKFIKIALRLNGDIPVDELLASCENLAPPSSVDSRSAAGVIGNSNSFEGCRNGERAYSDENAKLVNEIKRTRDYYAILGVEKRCSVEEIRRAYKKLSLKVHPDKNKAPGSEEAFNKVCKAFKCLSEEESRRNYDQNGILDEFDHNQRCNNVRRRRYYRMGRTNTNVNVFFHDDFDPNEVFRSFFGQSDVFWTSNVRRTRRMDDWRRGSDHTHGGLDVNITLLLLLVFFIVLFLATIPFWDPEYSLHPSRACKLPRVTQNYGIEYYVKSSDFDKKFPLGSSSREIIEGQVVNKYRIMLGHYCRVEIRRRQWDRNYPTPNCDRLYDLNVY
ncbi:hypothetical protein Scep_030713 [Stephania cephalantha]|uniref:J domain-containing protein n=1 Tax=Stephania cephalantha TaxID=152367 RepID=A0AAP0E4M6_9MAGN